MRERVFAIQFRNVYSLSILRRQRNKIELLNYLKMDEELDLDELLALQNEPDPMEEQEEEDLAVLRDWEQQIEEKNPRKQLFKDKV